MKKIALYFKCPRCRTESRFDKTDLPAGFISPDDINENKIRFLTVECPACEQKDFLTLEDVKKALENPKLAKWKLFWKDK